MTYHDWRFPVMGYTPPIAIISWAAAWQNVSRSLCLKVAATLSKALEAYV